MWTKLLLLLLLWEAGSTMTVDNCPSKLDQMKLKVWGNKCYYFHLQSYVEYNRAQNICKNHGGNLVSIKTERMQNFIHGHLKNTFGYRRPVWIGLTDKRWEGHFVWEDGSKMDYTNFDTASEKLHSFYLSNMDCVAMDSFTGRWSSYNCDNFGIILGGNVQKAFVCEFSGNNRQRTTTTSKPDTTITQTTEMSTTSTISATTTCNTMTCTTITTQNITATTTGANDSLCKKCINETTTDSSTTATLNTTTKPPTTPETSPITKKTESFFSTTNTRITPCPLCNLDCGMSRFNTSFVNGCLICECLND